MMKLKSRKNKTGEPVGEEHQLGQSRMKRIISSNPFQFSRLFVAVAFFLSVTNPLPAQEIPALEWARSLVGTGNQSPAAIAADGAGNVYTAGAYDGTVDFDPGAGVFNLTSAGYRDIYISKVDANGNFVWARSFGGNNFAGDFAESIATDALGNVYTSGFFSAGIDFDPGAGVFNLAPTGSYGSFFLKLTTDGNFVWAKSMEGTGYAQTHPILTDGDGSVYSTGTFSGTVDFDPGAGVFNLAPIGGTDIFVSKLDTDGNFVWAKSMGGTQEDEGFELAIDPLGNLYAAGNFEGTADFDPGTGVYDLIAATTIDYDAFIFKLDNNGNFIWAKSMATEWTYFRLQSIATDALGNVYTVGHFQNTVDFDPGTGISNLTSAGNWDIFISKLDDDGNFTWAKSVSGSSGNYAYAITTDNSGNVFITGNFYQTADFDPGAAVFNLTAHSFHLDTYISKLDTDGNFVWAGSVGGSNDITGRAITLDPVGNIHITGEFRGTIDFDFSACTFNLTSLGGGNAFIQKIKISTAVPPPTIASFSPTSGPTGTTITITGTNFSTTPANNIVAFNGTAATVTGSTATTITATVPAGATTGKISVTVNCNTVQSATNFTVGTSLPPTITSFTPTSGPVGTTVTINGTNFSATPANNIVRFNGTTAVITASTATSVTTTVPTGATTGTITVTVAGNTATSSTNFTVTAAPSPTITSFDPTSGPIGAIVTITGTNFSATPANNTVVFNETTAVVTASTATSITTTVPAGATTGKISVTVGGKTATSAADFTVTTIVSDQPPVIASTTTAAFIEGVVVVDLEELITDENNNLDPTSLQVSMQPISGAPASLNGFELTIDYSGFPFTGSDRVGIEACDLTALCTEQELTIELGGDVTVYNALSPDGNGKNDIFFIQYIDILPETQSNKVTIFNRWGDVVIEVKDYNNDDRVFTGLNKDGKELPSGTYFYKIEFSSGTKTKTGYLSLKR